MKKITYSRFGDDGADDAIVRQDALCDRCGDYFFTDDWHSCEDEEVCHCWAKTFHLETSGPRLSA